MKDNVSIDQELAEIQRRQSQLDKALKKIIEEMYTHAEAAEEATRKNGTDQQWNRAYGFWSALRDLKDRMEQIE